MSQGHLNLQVDAGLVRHLLRQLLPLGHRTLDARMLIPTDPLCHRLRCNSHFGPELSGPIRADRFSLQK